MEEEVPQLNRKYANATLIKDNNVKELTMHGKPNQSKECNGGRHQLMP